MLFSGLHQLECLSDFLFELFRQVEEFLSGIVVRISPVLTFLSIQKGIVNVLHHVIEDTYGIGCELSEKDFFVAAFVHVDLI